MDYFEILFKPIIFLKIKVPTANHDKTFMISEHSLEDSFTGDLVDIELFFMQENIETIELNITSGVIDAVIKEAQFSFSSCSGHYGN